MPDRPLAEAHRETAPGDEVARGAHPGRAGSTADPHAAPGPRLVRCALEGHRGRLERVQDRLVARPATAATGEAIGRGAEHRGDGRSVQDRGVAGDEPGLDAGRAVQRPGGTADRGDQAVPDRPQDVAGRGLGGQIGQQVVDRAEADDEVVAVVAVAQHSVEPGEARRMAGDDRPAAGEPGTQPRGVEDRSTPGSAMGVALVDRDGTFVPGAARRSAECRRRRTLGNVARPRRHPNATSSHLLMPCWHLDESGRRIARWHRASKGGVIGGLGSDLPQRFGGRGPARHGQPGRRHEVPVGIAGGTEDGRLGTSAPRIAAALRSTLDAGADGVLVLFDLGSAALSLELALDDLDPVTGAGSVSARHRSWRERSSPPSRRASAPDWTRSRRPPPRRPRWPRSRGHDRCRN